MTTRNLRKLKNSATTFELADQTLSRSRNPMFHVALCGSGFSHCGGRGVVKTVLWESLPSIAIRTHSSTTVPKILSSKSTLLSLSLSFSLSVRAHTVAVMALFRYGNAFASFLMWVSFSFVFFSFSNNIVIWFHSSSVPLSLSRSLSRAYLSNKRERRFSHSCRTSFSTAIESWRSSENLNCRLIENRFRTMRWLCSSEPLKLKFWIQIFIITIYYLLSD